MDVLYINVHGRYIACTYIHTYIYIFLVSELSDMGTLGKICWFLMVREFMDGCVCVEEMETDRILVIFVF